MKALPALLALVLLSSSCTSSEQPATRTDTPTSSTAPPPEQTSTSLPATSTSTADTLPLEETPTEVVLSALAFLENEYDAKAAGSLSSLVDPLTFGAMETPDGYLGIGTDPSTDDAVIVTSPDGFVWQLESDADGLPPGAQGPFVLTQLDGEMLLYGFADDPSDDALFRTFLAVSETGSSWRDLEVDITLSMDRNGWSQTFVSSADGSIAAFAGPTTRPTDDLAYATYAYRPGDAEPTLLITRPAGQAAFVRATTDDILLYWLDPTSGMVSVASVNDDHVEEFDGELSASIAGSLLFRDNGRYSISTDGGASFSDSEGPDAATWQQGTFTAHGAVGIVERGSGEAEQIDVSHTGAHWFSIPLPPNTRDVTPLSIGPRGVLLLVRLDQQKGELLASIPWETITSGS